jgi:hypothetical protein
MKELCCSYPLLLMKSEEKPKAVYKYYRSAQKKIASDLEI